MHQKASHQIKRIKFVNDSDSDPDVPEESKCSICKRFYSSEMKNLGYAKIVNWGQCDICEKWVYL